MFSGKRVQAAAACVVLAVVLCGCAEVCLAQSKTMADYDLLRDNLFSSAFGQRSTGNPWSSMGNIFTPSMAPANISAMSEVPLAVAVAMESDGGNTMHTSTSFTGNGGSSSSISMSSSSSSSSSSTTSGANSESNDRVAMSVASPDAVVTFNVGPTLENIGVEITPASQASTGQIIIGDGATSEKIGVSYPIINVTITSPLLNFSYGQGVEGTADYTVCARTLSSGMDVDDVKITAPYASMSQTFPANMEIGSADDIYSAFKEVYNWEFPKSADPPVGSDMGADVLVSMVSPLTGKVSMVNANGIFSLQVADQWDGNYEQLEAQVPTCVTRSCANGNCEDKFTVSTI